MTTSRVVFLVFLVILCMFASNTQPAESQSYVTIYIRSDGSVEGTDKIQREGDTYTLTDDIGTEIELNGIVVERDNILVDGAGHIVEGTTGGIGILLSDRSYVTVRNVTIKAFSQGIRIENSLSNVIFGNNITQNTEYGVFLLSSSSNSISGNSISNSSYAGVGVLATASFGNSISNNNITSNGHGIWLQNSLNNTLMENKVANNSCYGIWLDGSQNNKLGQNVMIRNRYSFQVSGQVLSQFLNDVDASNTVDSKPIYYWINRRDQDIPLDAGYVALINSTNITAKNLALKSNGQAILMVLTCNSTIALNSITTNANGGIMLFSSSNNDLSRNNITDSIIYGMILGGHSSGNRVYENNISNTDEAFHFGYSSNNSIFHNNLRNNHFGVYLDGDSKYNSIFENNIKDNLLAIGIYDQVQAKPSQNSFFHNSFLSNTYNIYNTPDSLNIWDDGYPSGGNYWSNYAGVDEKKGPNQDQLGSDGIGDTPYAIDSNNRDRYPIMIPRGDVAAPVTAHDYDGLWHTQDFMTTIIGADDLSGISETYYKINNGPTKTVSANGQPLITTEGANNTLEYWSVDKAGNEENHHILAGIKLDRTTPTGSIVINDNEFYTTSSSVTLTLAATDAISGVCQVRYSNDGIWDTETWEEFSAAKTWTITSWKGAKTVYYQIKDKAGLISSYSDSIILDITPPSANAGTDQAVNEDAPVTMDASDSTDESGITTYTWTFIDTTEQTLTGVNPTYTFTTPGAYTITLEVTDPAGNTATDTVRITVFDITKPTANAGLDQTVKAGATVNFDASSSSDNMGIVGYEWSFGDGTNATEKTTTHTYAYSGTYTVTLVVEDAAGNTATTSTTVIVLPGEAFPIWVVGITLIALVIAAAVTLLLRKRK